MEKNFIKTGQTSIWFKPVSIEQINVFCQKTAITHLGIEVIEIGNDFLSARMPVDHRTVQPIGLLHGGASVLLAETVGSVAADLCVDPENFYCVGLEINANHVRGVRSGWVKGTAHPLHLGRATQVWEIRITDETHRLVCVSRLTMAILERTKAG